MKKKKIVKRVTVKTKRLSYEQKEEIDRAFLLFDKDRSGLIDVNELRDALRALGIYIKKHQFRMLFNQVDKDGSGVIGKEEFTVFMAQNLDRRNHEEELRKTFQVYDEDDSGIITPQNLIDCGKQLGFIITEDDAMDMIQVADKTNKNGVNIDEFVHIMKIVGLIPKDM